MEMTNPLVQAKNMEDVMDRGLPWLMEAKQVAKQVSTFSSS